MADHSKNVTTQGQKRNPQSPGEYQHMLQVGMEPERVAARKRKKLERWFENHKAFMELRTRLNKRSGEDHSKVRAAMYDERALRGVDGLRQDQMTMLRTAAKEMVAPVLDVDRSKLTVKQDRSLLLGNFREYCLSGSIINKKGRKVRFEWTTPQREMARLMAVRVQADLPVMMIVAKARKWGCSLLATWWWGWQMLRHPNFSVMVILHTSGYLPEFRDRYRQMFLSLPDSLGIEIVADNKDRIILSNGSKVDFLSAGTKATASNVGRSTGYQGAHMTEIPFWFSPVETMTAARQAVYLAGGGTGIILESTPRGAHGTFFEEYMQAKRGETDFLAYFVAWHMADEYAKPVSPEQLRLWNLWRETGNDEHAKKAGWLPDPDKRIERFALAVTQYNWWNFTLKNQCGNDIATMRQEYGDDDITCFITSNKTAFDESTNEKVRHAVETYRTSWQWCSIVQDWRTSEYKMDMTQRVLTVRQEPVAGVQYLAVMDPALGGSNTADWTVLYIARRNVGSLEVVAKYKSKAQVQGVVDSTLPLLRWYRSPMLAIEANKGEAHIHEFKMRDYPALYRRQRFNVIEGNHLADALGFHTDARNRNVLLACLSKYIETGRLLCPDDDLYSEMTTFIVTEHGKKEAANGCTDDHVLAAAILCFLDEGLTLDHAPADSPMAQSELLMRVVIQQATIERMVRRDIDNRLRAPMDDEGNGGWQLDADYS